MSKALVELERLLNTCFSCHRDFFDEVAPACPMCVNSPAYPREAPSGQIFICGACGKRSLDLFGIDDPEAQTQSWDESCMVNAVLCYQDSLQVVPGYEPTPRKGRKLS